MILITGASRGVGKFLFESYTQLGEKVFGTFNNSSVNFANYENAFCNVDVTKESDVQKWIESIDNLQHITLINCAGINYNAFAHKADLTHWKQVIDVNLVGTFNVIHKVLPLMRENNYGRIINFSSVVAQKATPGISAYAASKAALWGMTKSIAQENATKGITINNINLGYSELGMIEQVPDKFKEVIKSQIPCGEFIRKEDVFNTVEYIRNTAFLTGVNIDLNGGLF